MSGATVPSDVEHREYVALHLLAELREVVDQLHQRLDLVGVRGLGEAVERRLERGQRRLEGVEQVLQARDVLVGDVDDAGRALHQRTGRRGDAVDLGDQRVGTVHELEHPGHGAEQRLDGLGTTTDGREDVTGSGDGQAHGPCLPGRRNGWL